MRLHHLATERRVTQPGSTPEFEVYEPRLTLRAWPERRVNWLGP
ncbi:hypothetical protein MCEMSEM23_01821 [Rhabdaerophilaceae bacterium]